MNELIFETGSHAAYPGLEFISYVIENDLLASGMTGTCHGTKLTA